MVRSQLPSGTVTFLFTDIEGSTRLIEELGEEGYVKALADHRGLLRAAFSAQRGVEVDTQGDAFLYAFGNPVDALAAAARGQEALEKGPVRVRMGLHTGEPRLTGEGYAGRELHRAARIAASGHGGQVVVSAATQALGGAELTGLGEHRLKDFPEPVALFQLGAARFPPLKTISNTNLPRPASSFVGRQRERDELVALLSNGTRLLTLSGPGGSGKTRLALETAAALVPAFNAGVFWIALAALRDPALVSETIAQTLGAKDGLAEHIGERELLLLLDNFEQVVEAAPELSELLERCAHLKLLITSRELLRIGGEVEYPVPPLAEPEAVELFCTRSRLEPDETIAELCRRLDDLPLALELAAARTSVLSPAQILERLSQRLDLLRGGRDAEARQQTLRATIEWSHDLLDTEEQRLFARLAVFRGGCTLEAAEQVADADLEILQSLVEKSLLRHTNERFWMLETIRAYARELLVGSGDAAELRRRRAFFFLGFVEEAAREGEEPGGDQTYFERIAAEYDNLVAALEWARDSDEDEILLRLSASMGASWHTRALHQELDTWLPLALDRASSPALPRMRALRWAHTRAASKRDWMRSEALIAEWRRIAEEEGNEFQVLRAMNAAASNASARGEFNDAEAQFTAIAKKASEIGELGMVAITTVNLGQVAGRSRDFRLALEYARAAADLFRGLDDEYGTAVALENCGWSCLDLSDFEPAADFFHQALAVWGRLGAISKVVASAQGLAAALVGRHELERGTQLLGAAARLGEELDVGFSDAQEEETHESALADAKAALGGKAFAAAWARGEAMTLEDVVAFAQTE
jgi:predicted ATPase